MSVKNGSNLPAVSPYKNKIHEDLDAYFRKELSQEKRKARLLRLPKNTPPPPSTSYLYGVVYGYTRSKYGYAYDPAFRKAFEAKNPAWIPIPFRKKRRANRNKISEQPSTPQSSTQPSVQLTNGFIMPPTTSMMIWVEADRFVNMTNRLDYLERLVGDKR